MATLATLPTELIDEIVERLYVDHIYSPHHTLGPISLVCRAFLGPTQARMVCNVDVDKRRRVVDLIALFRVRPDLARSVQSVWLAGEDVYASDGTHARTVRPRAAEVDELAVHTVSVSRLSVRCVDELAAAVVRAFARSARALESLTLAPDESRGRTSEAEDLMAAVVVSAIRAHAGSLRTLAVLACGTPFKEAEPVKLPNLQYLTLDFAAESDAGAGDWLLRDTDTSDVVCFMVDACRSLRPFAGVLAARTSELWLSAAVLHDPHAAEALGRFVALRKLRLNGMLGETKAMAVAHLRSLPAALGALALQFHRRPTQISAVLAVLADSSWLPTLKSLEVTFSKRDDIDADDERQLRSLAQERRLGLKISSIRRTVVD